MNIMGKSPKDSQPETKPEFGRDNSTQSTQERLHWIEVMELLIKKRTRLGEYNTDAEDILTIAKAVRFLLQR